MINKCGFKILQYIKRSDLVKESEEVLAFSGDTVFWIVQKII